jgi:hypothetical protein
MTEWDEYRVNLFKQKIRAALPELRSLRFERSVGRSALIINVRWRYYRHADELFPFILGRLKRSGIDAEAKTMFSFSTRPDYITVPIDQAALPERKRPLACRPPQGVSQRSKSDG